MGLLRGIRRTLLGVGRKILARSSFDAANGTSLDAITPEKGPAWTEIHEENGASTVDFDIQGNLARCVRTYDGVNAVRGWACVDAGEADVDIRATVTTDPANDSNPGIIARITDENNLWMLQIITGGDEVAIYERNGGGFTKRASAAVTIDLNTSYRLRLVAKGQTLTGYVNGANKVSYSSAILNENETTHGIAHSQTANSTTTYWNDFVIYKA